MFKKELILLFGILVYLLSISVVLALPGTWAGYVYTDGTIAADNTIVNAIINNASKVANTSVHGPEYDPSAPLGYYMLSVEGSLGDKVNFDVCGVNVSIPSEDWSSGPHYNGSQPNFNLSINKLAAGASCTYSCACAGGYCCSGTVEYSSGNGTGTCQASACGVPLGNGGTQPSWEGGPADGITPTKKEESKTFITIVAGSTGYFGITDSDTFKIMEINITVVNQSNNVKITINEGLLPNGAPLPVPEGVGLVYKYLEITKGNITNANISLVKIKFKVSKTWLNNNSISSGSIALYRYSAGSWTTLHSFTEKVSEDARYYYYVAETNALSTFAIAGEFVTEKVDCPYECCVGQPEYFDKGCPEDYECDLNTCKEIVGCPTCGPPSAWSACIEGKRTRSNYRCSSETNYQCEAYTETENCVPPLVLVIPFEVIMVIVVLLAVVVVVVFVLRKRRKKPILVIKI